MKSSVSKFCVLVLKKKKKASAKGWVSFVLLENPNNHSFLCKQNPKFSGVPSREVLPIYLPCKVCILVVFTLQHLPSGQDFHLQCGYVNGGGKWGEYHGKFYEVIT